ncbi:MAG TPA: hypothetical protein VD735_03360 [Candidatus Saccharimonadales bacterium]|nr:hypothetical protein [Candidatus Saccharimonadales bacterium]
MQKSPKITRRRSFFKRPIIIGAAILLLLVTAGGVYAFKQQQANDQVASRESDEGPREVGDVDYGPADERDNDASDKAKDNPTNAPDTLDGFPADTSGNVSVLVSRADADNTAKTLQVGTIVEGATAGTCQLKLTKSGQADVVRTATIVAENNTSSCEIFTVPYGDIPASGDWQVDVTVLVNGKTASGDWPDKVAIVK